MTTPAIDFWTFAVTIPAGTPRAAPAVTNIAMPVRRIETIQAMVPDGWNGVAGFALGAAGQPVIPYGHDTWVIASGETLTWTLADLIESGAWQVFGWNTGIYDHTVYLRFTASLTNAAPDQAAAVIATVQGLTS